MSVMSTVIRLLRGKSKVTPMIGTFVGFSGALATVDAGGGRFPAKTATGVRPQIGEPVWVVWIDEVPFMLGPTVAKPGTGRVQAVSSGLATVQTDIGLVNATYTAGLMLSAGQLVKLLWNEGAHIAGVIATALPVPAPPEAPNQPAPMRHTDTFFPDSSGSWNSANGWGQAQVLADTPNLGLWFYGTKISDTLAGATVTSIEIFIAARVVSGAPNFATHLYPAQPAEQPVLSNATPIDVVDGAWVALPLSFGNTLAASPGGIGVAHGGTSRFKSVPEDGQSGALRITSTY